MLFAWPYFQCLFYAPLFPLVYIKKCWVGGRLVSSPARFVSTQQPGPPSQQPDLHPAPSPPPCVPCQKAQPHGSPHRQRCKRKTECIKSLRTPIGTQIGIHYCLVITSSDSFLVITMIRYLLSHQHDQIPA